MGLRESLTHNASTKLLALGLALLLYAGVFVYEERETVVRIPLSVAGLPEGRMLLDPAPEEVVAKVAAPGLLTLQMRLFGVVKNELAAVVRVPPDAETVNRTLHPSDIVVPLDSGVRIVEIVKPETIQFRLDRRVERTVPVKPVVTGTLPGGFSVSGEVVVEPPEVTIMGPASLVEDLERVATEPLDMSGRKRAFDGTVAPALDPRLRSLPEFVRVSVNIEPTDQYELTGVPVLVRNLGARVGTVEPATAILVVIGPKSELTRLRRMSEAGQATGIAITLDAAGLKPGRHVVSPAIELKGQLDLIAIRPPRFAITIQ